MTGSKLEPVLALEELVVSYARSTPVVDHVSLSVLPGQVLSVIGESGSGKSTTLLAIAGLLPSEAHVSGDLRLSGRRGNLLAPGADRRGFAGGEVAMIFQNPAASLNPVIQIGRQLEEVVAVHHRLPRASARARAEDLLARVGLRGGGRKAADWARAYPHQLSGGQKQRVAIAAALAGSPRVLLADEPTTALDTTVQAQILDLLLKLVDTERIALVFVTHDLNIAASIGDRITVLKDGRIVEQGASRRVVTASRSSYTTRLLDAAHQLTPGRNRQARIERPPTNAEDGLRLTGTSRRYSLRGGGSVQALDTVDVSVSRGEIVGLIGESGSGKTTLGRIAVGLDRPDAGTIDLDGQPFDPSRDRGVVQMVFQDPLASFNPRHSMHHAVEIPLRYLRALPQRNRSEEATQFFEKVGLDPTLGHRRRGGLSGGQLQRAAIARALASGPQFLVCDEAVSSLDMPVRVQVLELLKELCEGEGLGILFISHDLGMVARIADRTIVLQHGRVVESGSTGHILSTPDTSYVRQLIASIPVREEPWRKARTRLADGGHPRRALD